MDWEDKDDETKEDEEIKEEEEGSVISFPCVYEEYGVP